MHVFDHVIGFFAPCMALWHYSLIEGLFQQNGQRVNQLQRALHAFDVIEIFGTDTHIDVVEKPLSAAIASRC